MTASSEVCAKCGQQRLAGVHAAPKANGGHVFVPPGTAVNWLEALQVGAPVIVVSGHGTRRAVQQVQRVTRTLVYVGRPDAHRPFRRDTGTEYGGGMFDKQQLEPATPDAVRVVRAEALRRRRVGVLRAFDWSNATDEQLAQVVRTLELEQPTT